MRPGKSGGLQEHRWLAYICWAIFLLLLPAIAFVNKQEPYVSQGTYCYLPIRPFWYRIVLSWTPRYCILCTIIAIYLVIYIYTKKKFGRFDISMNSGTTGTAEPISKTNRPEAQGLRPPLWKRCTAVRRGKQQQLPSESQALPMISTPAVRVDSISSGDETAPDLSSGLPRKTTLLEALRDRSLFPVSYEMPKNDNSALRKRHREIQRQLRYMFIYPLVYILMWIPPFINHCYYYTVEYNPPFELNCVSLTFLSLQCAVDCLIFNIRERPWRSEPVKGNNSAKLASVTEGSVITEPQTRRGSKDPEDQRGRRSQSVQGSVDGQTDQPRTVRKSRSRPKPKHWWDNESV